MQGEIYGGIIVCKTWKNLSFKKNLLFIRAYMCNNVAQTDYILGCRNWEIKVNLRIVIKKYYFMFQGNLKLSCYLALVISVRDDELWLIFSLQGVCPQRPPFYYLFKWFARIPSATRMRNLPCSLCLAVSQTLFLQLFDTKNIKWNRKALRAPYTSSLDCRWTDRTEGFQEAWLIQ